MISAAAANQNDPVEREDPRREAAGAEGERADAGGGAAACERSANSISTGNTVIRNVVSEPASP